MPKLFYMLSSILIIAYIFKMMLNQWNNGYFWVVDLGALILWFFSLFDTHTNTRVCVVQKQWHALKSTESKYGKLLTVVIHDLKWVFPLKISSQFLLPPFITSTNFNMMIFFSYIFLSIIFNSIYIWRYICIF